MEEYQGLRATVALPLIINASNATQVGQKGNAAEEPIEVDDSTTSDSESAGEQPQKQEVAARKYKKEKTSNAGIAEAMVDKLGEWMKKAEDREEEQAKAEAEYRQQSLAQSALITEILREMAKKF